MVGGKGTFSVGDETGGFVSPGFSVIRPGVNGESLIAVIGTYVQGNRYVLGESEAFIGNSDFDGSFGVGVLLIYGSGDPEEHRWRRQRSGATLTLRQRLS